MAVAKVAKNSSPATAVAGRIAIPMLIESLATTCNQSQLLHNVQFRLILIVLTVINTFV